jgi:hypothetical protein
LKIALPKESKNRVIQAANLIKKGFAKWETYPKTTRNIVAGISMVASGILVPKGLFLLLISSVYASRHMYLSGEVEGAVDEVITTTVEEDYSHP